MIRRLLLLAALLAPGATMAQVRVVGGPGGGCIQGAVELPSQGPGWQTIRVSHSFYWGHPDTIAALELLAQRARAAGLADLYMNDISKPRGGPFPGVHLSHMMGLDADVWLDLRPKPALSAAQRDALEVASLVRADGRDIEASRWSAQHATLLRLASELPGVDRVLVNPAIKKHLCETVAGDRSWIAKIRPWYGHAAHMHIHFRCPEGQAECVDQAPRPGGEGCDASLQWWFDQMDAPVKAPGPPKPPRAVVLPAACTAILAGK